MRSQVRSRRIAWILTIIGLALIVVVVLSLWFRGFGGSAMAWCLSDASAPGEIETGRPEDNPIVRHTLFPFGLECSLFAGDGQPRVADFLDLGTVPLYAGITCLLAGIIILMRGRRS